MATRTINGKEYTKVDFENKLRHLSDAQELAAMLNELKLPWYYSDFRGKQLSFLADTNNVQRRCKTFRLRKKHGGYREITAPKGGLRGILNALNILLQTYDEPTPWAFGFVCGRSVVDNARPHVGKRYILNLDLKDFFPTITRQQVADCLTAEPFGFSSLAAKLISGLATVHTKNNEEVLAQGFATSPTLSNFICREMDKEIASIATAQGITFTRYADDLTFSADTDILRPQGELVQQVKTIVERYGFRLNEEKTHLQRRGRRQEVTGLMVTEKVNVSRRYVREIRSLLYIWERYGYEDACQAAWKSYRQQHGKTKEYLYFVPLNAVLRGKLNYMKMVRGADDPLYQRFVSRYNALQKTNKREVKEVTYKAYMGKYLSNSTRDKKRKRILNFILMVIILVAIILIKLFLKSLL
ncbi:RNA-directed DNA polymerase [Prevotella scopos JCM 17725]|uniref:RNA-directed DNA polymerase n=1 Tax=Prevotella scopos JCM 17725 TaxID=1236518 RepID=A0AAX2F5A3_9BACT|nr:reverse transcriptase family protein [Prevotella scopos]ANR72217.1 RNA-dependent DNA polymerase [Prevotella scopos JCM 17725]QUB45581.1 RNA-directed DNA polymerase [Prevotella scopos JCM 17725]SHF99164.1 Reverse transcriptase (RNA-dependent DNA polymerase) [Prevotella scopos JCM 17725]